MQKARERNHGSSLDREAIKSTTVTLKHAYFAGLRLFEGPNDNAQVNEEG